MAWTYAEKREQPTPSEQERWRCAECHREWIYARVFGANWIDREWEAGENCPVCGSPEVERIRFRGVYDSSTPDEVMAQVAELVGDAQLSDEALRRQRLSGGVDATAPPVTLLPEQAVTIEPVCVPVAQAVPTWPPAWATR